MATGIAIPIRVGPTGSTVRSSGDAQADKIIRLALSDGDNDNAFQQGITLGVNEVFSPRSPGFRAKTLSRLFKIFDRFQRDKLFQLIRSSIRWSNGGQGEAILEFKYRNLESDEVLNYAQTFSAGQGGSL